MGGGTDIVELSGAVVTSGFRSNQSHIDNSGIYSSYLPLNP
jgi:hypothetical protein